MGPLGLRGVFPSNESLVLAGWLAEVNGGVGAWVSGWVGRWVVKWVDGWLGGWVNGNWVNGWLAPHHIQTHPTPPSSQLHIDIHPCPAPFTWETDPPQPWPDQPTTFNKYIYIYMPYKTITFVKVMMYTGFASGI